MAFRKLLLRIMLWALGAAAISGAGAVLFQGHETGWRIVATGVITAVAAGLMIPASLLADREKSRRQGVLGLGLVIVEFIGAMILVWDIPDLFSDPWRSYERIALTMACLGGAGFVAILMLRLSQFPAGKLAGRLGAGVAAASFALLEMGIWSWDYSLEDKWLLSGWAVAGFGMLAVFSLFGVGVPPRRWWRWIGVGASALAGAGALYAIWAELHSGSDTFAILVGVAAVVAHANVCMLVPLMPGQGWVRACTIGAGVVTAAMIDLLVIAELHDLRIDFAENLAGAAGIVAACGSLALLVLARINRNLDRLPVLSEIRQITVVCPGCRKKQAVPVGRPAGCRTCGMKILVRLEEPRCPRCDYLLYMLRSERCPECGMEIAPCPTYSPDGPDAAEAGAGLPEAEDQATI